jgi:hypothetical protein
MYGGNGRNQRHGASTERYDFHEPRDDPELPYVIRYLDRQEKSILNIWPRCSFFFTLHSTLLPTLVPRRAAISRNIPNLSKFHFYNNVLRHGARAFILNDRQRKIV